MEYDIKRGWYKNIEGEALGNLMREIFGNVNEDGDALVSSYGALVAIRVWVKDKSSMEIVTEAAKSPSDEEILDTKRKLNLFTEKATGFNAKQRRDRAKKKAKDGTL